MTSKLRHAAFNTPEYSYHQNVIAKFQKPKKTDKQSHGSKKLHHRKPVSRCPTCGGLVVMPCVICQSDQYSVIIANHRVTGTSRQFQSLSDFAANIKNYTAGQDIDTLARRLL